MVEVFVVMTFLALVVLLIFLPVIIQYFAWKRAEKRFNKELALLNQGFETSLIIETRRLGEGESRNSDVRFFEANNNQAFAVSTIMDVYSAMVEE